MFANELLKTFRKWRSSIAFIAVGVVIPLIYVGFWMQGDAVARSLMRGVGEDFLLLGNLMNGYLATYIVMNALWIHIPFLITLGAGDQLAGEATAGTFRILLIRPVSRTRILLAKYATALFYTTALVLFVALLSILLGVAVFGTGDVLIAGSTLTVLPESQALWRLGAAFAVALWGMWTVASLAFLLSSLVENAIGPIIGTLAVIIVFYVVSNIPVDLFRTLRPYLFTTYLNAWQQVMEEPIPWRDIGWSLARLGAFTIGFFAAAWYIFTRKDILS